jgi:hypothetical protein
MDAALIADAIDGLCSLSLHDAPVDHFAAVLHASSAPDEAAEDDDNSGVADGLDSALEAVCAISGAVGDAEQARPFWEAVSTITPHAAKAIQIRLFEITNRGKRAASTEDVAARLGVKAAELYWALLACPGAAAYGFFDAALTRSVAGFSSRFMELACFTAPSTGQSKARAQGRSKVQPPVVAAGSRRNPSRSSSASQGAAAARSSDGGLADVAASSGAADMSGHAAMPGDDDASEGSDGDASIDETDEDEDRPPQKSRPPVRAGVKRRGRGGGGKAPTTEAGPGPVAAAFSPELGGLLAGLLASAVAGLARFDLRVQVRSL